MSAIKNNSILLFSIYAIAASSCSQTPAAERQATQEYCIPDSLLQNITLDTVRSEPVMNELILSGKIAVNEEKQAKVFPLASGHVVEVKASLGDYVKQGQVLVVIRSSDMANYFDEYNSSKSELTIAKKSLDVADDMYKSGLITEKEYINAQTDYQKALSASNKITEILKVYGTTEKEGTASGAGYVIKAPANGFIVEKNVNPGMDVRPDAGNNLFTIADLNEVWVVANAYETDIEKINIGYLADVTVLSYSTQNFPGRIDKISNILNPETNVLNVKIRLDNPGYLLKPGMFTRITIRYPDNKQMLAIPSGAVIFDDNKNWVLRYKDKCHVEMQQVTVYKHLEGKTYIQGSNLQENNRLITRNGIYIFTALKLR